MSGNGNGDPMRVPLVRIPLDHPLTRQELSVTALLSEGWEEAEIARMLGVDIRTVHFHMNSARGKIPGDLPRKARIVAWYRGAPLSVLSGSSSGAFDALELPASLTVQGTLHRAQAISEGRGCPCCGYDGVRVIEDVRYPRNRLGQIIGSRKIVTDAELETNGRAESQGAQTGDG